ncbi:hypothetical protein [Chamaesiphon sp.]|uniref:hypothetical protein n=1 Tax=Chamaesiphon sp. TaxID=2814140 RepID=UPI003593C03C
MKKKKFSLIDGILNQARSDQEDMEKKLGNLQTELKQQWVISREQLAERLERWMELGLPAID